MIDPTSATIASSGQRPNDTDSAGLDDESDVRVHTDHDADLVEQLFRDYETSFSLTAIVQVFNQCRRDLAGCPPEAMPEMLARLARCRLSAMLVAEPESAD
jgi:hypothetical protein